jgi:hypothetical protein
MLLLLGFGSTGNEEDLVIPSEELVARLICICLWEFCEGGP